MPLVAFLECKVFHNGKATKEGLVRWAWQQRTNVWREIASSAQMPTRHKPVTGTVPARQAMNVICEKDR